MHHLLHLLGNLGVIHLGWFFFFFVFLRRNLSTNKKIPPLHAATTTNKSALNPLCTATHFHKNFTEHRRRSNLPAPPQNKISRNKISSNNLISVPWAPREDAVHTKQVRLMYYTQSIYYTQKNTPTHRTSHTSDIRFSCIIEIWKI